MAVVGSRKPWWRRILKRLAVALVAFVAVAAYQAWRVHDDATKQLDKYAVGDCLVLTKQGLGVEDTKADCGRDPSYTIAGRIADGAKCPNDNYVTIEVTARGDSVGGLCLVENYVAGHCYRSDLISKVIELTGCGRGSTLTSTVEVLSRQDNAAAACAAGQVAIAYPEPAPGRSYCIAAS